MQSLCEKYFGMVKTANMPCAMTVAGSDSGAGAGIQADILAIAANGVYACSVVTALTAQNPDGVYGVLPAGGIGRGADEGGCGLLFPGSRQDWNAFRCTDSGGSRKVF